MMVMVVDMVVGGRETHSSNRGPSNQVVGLINMRGDYEPGMRLRVLGVVKTVPGPVCPRESS